MVLEHERHRHKDEVQEKHREPKSFVHLPTEAGDGHDDEDQHHEQNCNRAHHPNRVYLHGFAVDDAV